MLCIIRHCFAEAIDDYIDLYMCEAHLYYYRYKSRESYFLSKINYYYNTGMLVQHTPGITYILLLPNGNIKIGYSKNHRTLRRRLLDLRREFQGNGKLLATVPGGETMEACLHYKFRDHRIQHIKLEQFTTSPEILAYCEEVGFEVNGLYVRDSLIRDGLLG